MRLPASTVPGRVRRRGDQHSGDPSSGHAGTQETRHRRDDARAQAERQMPDLRVGEGATQGLRRVVLPQVRSAESQGRGELRDLSRDRTRNLRALPADAADSREQDELHAQRHAGPVEEEERRTFSQVLSCVSGGRTRATVHGGVRDRARARVLRSGQLVRYFGKMYEEREIKTRHTVIPQLFRILPYVTTQIQSLSTRMISSSLFSEI